MSSIKKYDSIFSSNTFLAVTSGISTILFLTNYYQHKKTSKKVNDYLNHINRGLSSASFRNFRHLIPKKSSQDELKDTFDADSEFFLQEFSENPHKSESDYSSVKIKISSKSKIGLSQASLVNPKSTPSSSSPPVRKLGSVDKRFLFQIKAILRILIPNWYCKEIFIICIHSLFLVLRTWISVVIAELDGKIVKYLIQAKGKKFLGGLLTWFVLSIPATYTNSMIRYLESKLSIAFRTRLFTYVNNLYLNDQNNYYKISNLDTRIKNPDQYITADITRFCSSLSLLFSSIGKPTLDMIIFNIQLTRSLGSLGTGALAVFYFISVAFLRKITPPFGKLVATQAVIEGQFRADHARIVTSSEEIAFYKGDKTEKKNVIKSLNNLINFSLLIMKKRFYHVIAEDMVVKYIWSSIGYILCAFPFFRNIGSLDTGAAASAKRMQQFITNKRIMVNISEAGGKLMYSTKKVMELSGYTERVFSLIQTCHALRLDYYPDQYNKLSSPSSDYELTLAGARRVVYDDFMGIKLTCVPIIAPNTNPYLPGEILVQPLIWHVKPGDHWFVKGPGGVGKTSMLRIISEIWPVFSGVVEKPPAGEIMYVPFRAYMCIGTLRDQIIYPDTYEEMIQNGCTDRDLLEILKVATLEYLPDREGGLDSVKAWNDVLSGGERQRMCMARLFYHQPIFAILDECTSAVSFETEGKMYDYAKSIGITLITISHRNSLAKYHDYILRLGDSYASSMPSLGVKQDDISPSFELDKSNSTEKDVASYAGRAWTDVELAALDESEDIIQATSANNDVYSKPDNNYGVAWQTAKINNSKNEHQKTDLSPSTTNNITDSQSDNSIELSEGSSDFDINVPSSDKSEVLRLRNVLSERKQIYQKWESRLKYIKSYLSKVELDQSVIDALK
ncbi:ATP-binding cassette sub-family D member 2 [Smittium culicis]|uniref:ATP-binding cassette sub-family D member 2 n=1 Tax=Smittium culicis TaxID=133412 RepID=A0A1R1X2Q4_9FUNG|nr:ATP-binding cassette sub-family D member 2 [Smittium culicis]